MNNILSPSILAADFMCLGDQIREVEEAGVPYLHFDVMDGIFVPSISFGMPVLQSVRKGTSLFLDVHLMITEPERYVEEFAKSGADMITFHIESTQDPENVIGKIRACGKKVGIAIKPATHVEVLKPYLDHIDMALVMTVEPGFGGQKLIPECLDKTRQLRDLCNEMGLELDIQVDGGIGAGNLEEVLASGANVIVAGSAVFKDSVSENAKAMLSIMK
jgi:ribulose-phosphate 3-epimerase